MVYILKIIIANKMILVELYTDFTTRFCIVTRFLNETRIESPL